MYIKDIWGIRKGQLYLDVNRTSNNIVKIINVGKHIIKIGYLDDELFYKANREKIIETKSFKDDEFDNLDWDLLS